MKIVAEFPYLLGYPVDVILDFTMEQNIWNRAYIESGKQKPIYIYIIYFADILNHLKKF